jgi:hypothetical protein
LPNLLLSSVDVLRILLHTVQVSVLDYLSD